MVGVEVDVGSRLAVALGFAVIRTCGAGNVEVALATRGEGVALRGVGTLGGLQAASTPANTQRMLMLMCSFLIRITQ
jgi:hypothetical protein